MITKVVIPALFVITHDDENTAKNIAKAMLGVANSLATNFNWNSRLYMDEGLPNAAGER